MSEKWSRAGSEGPPARARFARSTHPGHPIHAHLGFRVLRNWGRLLLAPREQRRTLPIGPLPRVQVQTLHLGGSGAWPPLRPPRATARGLPRLGGQLRLLRRRPPSRGVAAQWTSRPAPLLPLADGLLRRSQGPAMPPGGSQEGWFAGGWRRGSRKPPKAPRPPGGSQEGWFARGWWRGNRRPPPATSLDLRLNLI